MRVDVHTLGAFDGVAQRGARAATSALRSLTGKQTAVDVRGVNVVPAHAVHDRIDDRQAAIVMDLSGGVVGRAVLTVTQSDAGRLNAELPARVEDPSTAVLEVGNVLVGRLLDDIANGLRTGITVSPPVAVDVRNAFDDEADFLFECRLIAPRVGVAFDLYLCLRDGAVDRLLDMEASAKGVAPRASPSVGFEELSRFAELVSDGVEQAAEHASLMTGLDLSAEPYGLRFVTLSDVARSIDGDDRVGTAFSLSEPPGGFVVISFDRDSATRMGTAVVQGERRGGMVQEVVMELGTVMTSGLIDGWEDLFGRPIDHSAPEVIGSSAGAEILDPFAEWLDDHRVYGFLVDAMIGTPQGDIGCDIYAMPDELELLEAFDRPMR